MSDELLRRGARRNLLVTLRCPQRCELGAVYATTDGPRLVVGGGRLGGRYLTAQSEVASTAQRSWRGPFTLDELGVVDVGCRHSAGIVLDGWQQESLLAAVRTAQATRPGTHIVTAEGPSAE